MLAFAVCAGSEPKASAETFVLTSGARLEGKLLNPKQEPREQFQVELASGGKVALSKAQVLRVIAKSETETNYETFLAKMPDTLEAHWTMAEWCQKHNLPAQREFHLLTVVERDPQHEKARLALGYNNIDGKWVKPDVHAKHQGYVKFQGAWRTPQDVAIAEARQQALDIERKWRNDVKTWRGWVNRPSKSAEGLANLRGIRDLSASPAIAALLDDDQEPPQLKLEYVEILGRMSPKNPHARGTLVNHALYSELPEVREKCLDHLVNCDRSAVSKMFAIALDDKNNKVVNRAAVGLARMEDRSAIGPLIEHLSTKHKFIVKTGGGNLGASFGGGAGAGGLGGLSAGGSSSQQLEKKLDNEQVRAALVVLSEGQNFGYDQDAWKKWYSESQVPRDFDLRRKK